MRGVVHIDVENRGNNHIPWARSSCTLPGSIVADFRADVDVDGRSEEATNRTRVVLNESKLGLEFDGEKQVFELSNIFDVVQGVSRGREAGSTGTVTLASRTDGHRTAISIDADVERLVTFQQVLYKQLLSGTDVVFRCRDRAGTGEGGPHEGTLVVSPSRIQLRPDGTGESVSIARDEIINFETPSGVSGRDDQRPAVVIYADTGDRVLKTTASLPSFRLLNLLGRYLRADLLSTDAIGTASGDDDTIDLLFVDDDPHDIEMAGVFLRQQLEELSMTTATSAADALDILEGTPNGGGVNCIVSDYQMPGMDGIEFLNEVRERYPELPFILYTGQGSETVAKQAILDNVTDYVEKDVGRKQYEVLAERIRKATRS